MDFISAEEFLKQPEKVQKVFLDWWKPEVGDLVGIKMQCINSSWNTITKYKISCINEEDIFNYDSKEELLNGFKILGEHNYSDEVILLFTEGQLRKFIEDKFCKDYTVLEVIYCDSNMDWEYLIKLSITKSDYREFKTGEKDLLKAYWKVALILADEEVKLRELREKKNDY